MDWRGRYDRQPRVGARGIEPVRVGRAPLFTRTRARQHAGTLERHRVYFVGVDDRVPNGVV